MEMHKNHKEYSENPMEPCNNYDIFPEADHMHNIKIENSSSHNEYMLVKVSSKFRNSRIYQNKYLKYRSHCCELHINLKLDILKEKPDIKQKCSETIPLQ